MLIGDVAYACGMGQSELLRRGEGRGRLPRVMVSALPILDPLVPGRMENMPNNLAYVPQLGTSLSNRMVRPLQPILCLALSSADLWWNHILGAEDAPQPAHWKGFNTAKFADITDHKMALTLASTEHSIWRSED